MKFTFWTKINENSSNEDRIVKSIGIVQWVWSKYTRKNRENCEYSMNSVHFVIHDDDDVKKSDIFKVSTIVTIVNE